MARPFRPPLPTAVIVLAIMLSSCSAAHRAPHPSASEQEERARLIAEREAQAKAESESRTKAEAARKRALETAQREQAAAEAMRQLQQRENSRSASNGSLEIPQFEPWPPPRPSAVMQIPAKLLPIPGNSTFGDHEDRLRAVLLDGGYSDIVLFRVNGGFALVTRLERIQDNGQPLLDPRWALPGHRPDARTLLEFLQGMLFVQRGLYRMLVFTVSTESIRPSDQTMSAPMAEGLMAKGAMNLPTALASQPYSNAHRTSVLIYEFEQADQNLPARLTNPSELSALDHLRTSGVWAALEDY